MLHLKIVVYDLFGEEKGLEGELTGRVQGASKLLPRSCRSVRMIKYKLSAHLPDNWTGSHLPYKTGDACLQFCSRTNAGYVLLQIYCPLHCPGSKISTEWQMAVTGVMGGQGSRKSGQYKLS